MDKLTPAVVERMIENSVRKVRRRVQLMVGRAVLRSVSDSGGMQTVKVGILAGEEAQGAEHFQPFGITSVPPAGSEGVFLSVMGDRSHGVVICVNNRATRVRNLKTGETAVYNDKGVTVKLAEDGSVSVVPALAGQVNLGAEVAAQPVALNDSLTSAVDAAIAAAVTAAAPLVPPNGGDGGTAAFAAFQTAWNAAKASIAATKVKAT